MAAPTVRSTLRRAALLAARSAALVLAGALLVWTVGAVAFAALPSWLSWTGAAAVGVGVPAAWWLLRERRALVAAALGVAVLAGIGLQAAKRPRTDREWERDQAVPARAEFSGDLVTVRDVRNCRYRSETDFDVRLEDRTYDLRRLEGVDFMVDRRVAHTLVSFRFADDEFLAISVEIRRERGEAFGVLAGMFREFELLYVAADERDVIGLRAIHRGNPVHLYPLRATPEQRRELFLGMLRRMNALLERPEFYDSLTNTCTTNIADHVNRLAPGAVPFDLRVLLPGGADALAWELGLLDTELPLDAARRRFLVDPGVARAHADDPAFSAKIRGR